MTRKIDRKNIKKILFITLSNIGDIILTAPVMAVLNRDFPAAELDVMVGPAGADMFAGHPAVSRTIEYDKRASLKEKINLARELRSGRYDMIVDLRNTIFGPLARPRYRTPLLQAPFRNCMHKKDWHLSKLKYFGIDTRDAPFFLHITGEDRAHVDSLLRRIPDKDNIVIVSPTSKSLIKRWKKAAFSDVCDRLINDLKAQVVMVGDRDDRRLIEDITAGMDAKPFNFAGMTSIPQLAQLIKSTRLLITNDSAPMHIASAVGTKVLAIFGPTDPEKYRPLGSHDRVLRRDLECSPCETAQCRLRHECMEMISADEVFAAAREMLVNEPVNEPVIASAAKRKHCHSEERSDEESYPVAG